MPADTATPETTTDTAVEETGLARCGPGPYILTSIRLSKNWGDRGPLANGRLSLDPCPELVVPTDAQGVALIATTVGVPYDMLLEHPEMPSEAVGIHSGQIPTHLWMFQEPIDSKLPYNPDVPTLRVYPSTIGTTSPCTSRNGLTVWVKDRPAAKVHYYFDGVDRGAPDPLVEQVILIDGLPEGDVVEVFGSKAGCRVRKVASDVLIGKHKLHRKFVTTVWLQVEDEPDAG